MPYDGPLLFPSNRLSNDRKRNNISNRSPVPEYFQARAKLGRSNKVKRGIPITVPTDGLLVDGLDSMWGLLCLSVINAMACPVTFPVPPDKWSCICGTSLLFDGPFSMKYTQQSGLQTRFSH